MSTGCPRAWWWVGLFQTSLELCRSRLVGTRWGAASRRGLHAWAAAEPGGPAHGKLLYRQARCYSYVTRAVEAWRVCCSRLGRGFGLLKRRDPAASKGQARQSADCRGHGSSRPSAWGAPVRQQGACRAETYTHTLLRRWARRRAHAGEASRAGRGDGALRSPQVESGGAIRLRARGVGRIMPSAKRRGQQYAGEKRDPIAAAEGRGSGRGEAGARGASHGQKVSLA